MRDPYVDRRTGLNNVDAILEDWRSGRLCYADEEEEGEESNDAAYEVAE